MESFANRTLGVLGSRGLGSRGDTTLGNNVDVWSDPDSRGLGFGLFDSEPTGSHRDWV